MKPINTASAEHYQWGEVCDGWHLLKAGDLSVIEEQVPPGKSEVRHYHHHAKQFFYILAGCATMVCGDESILLQTGDGICIPPGVPHQFRNDSLETVRFLVVSVPPSHGDRVNL
ncbi:MAG: cupin domain-containing protein [Blastocatellia bacterium]|nr:cupin domain-containing protein [Blastocatellia bacterium]